MGFLAFAGYLLLGAGPLVVGLSIVSRKSFLVLLGLGSAFYWLTTLFVASALLRGFEPLTASAGPYAGVVLVAVCVQEAARLALGRFHLGCMRALARVAAEAQHAGAALTAADHFSLAATHGLAHASVHSLFFFVSWLPLCLGDGTIYTAKCPQMSYYLVGALSTLGFGGLLAGGTVICFEALERGSYAAAAAPAAAHLAAACLTLANFAEGGCVVTIPLLLAGGAAMAAWAGRLWWRRTGDALRASRPAPQPSAASPAAAVEPHRD